MGSLYHLYSSVILPVGIILPKHLTNILYIGGIHSRKLLYRKNIILRYLRIYFNLQALIIESGELKMSLYKGNKRIAGNGGVSKAYVDNAITGSISNPNLIDNPDFKINQRGLSVYRGIAGAAVGNYTVDRWLANGDVTVTPTDTGVSIEYGAGTTVGYRNIHTKVEDINRFKGKYLTFSAMINGGTVLKCTGMVPVDIESGYTIAKASLSDSINIRLQYHDGLGEHVLCVIEGATTVKWAKLELGTKATVFVPPDPATELMKCQRYFCKGKFAFKMSNAYYSRDFAIIPMVRFPVDMRVDPTVIIYSHAGTPNTLSVWSDQLDSTMYNTCVARTLSTEGFASLGVTDGSFSETDPGFYLGYYTASADL